MDGAEDLLEEKLPLDDVPATTTSSLTSPSFAGSPRPEPAPVLQEQRRIYEYEYSCIQPQSPQAITTLPHNALWDGAQALAQMRDSIRVFEAPGLAARRLGIVFIQIFGCCSQFEVNINDLMDVCWSSEEPIYKDYLMSFESFSDSEVLSNYETFISLKLVDNEVNACLCRRSRQFTQANSFVVTRQVL
jgi:hypothetical protein